MIPLPLLIGVSLKVRPSKTGTESPFPKYLSVRGTETTSPFSIWVFHQHGVVILYISGDFLPQPCRFYKFFVSVV